MEVDYQRALEIELRKLLLGVHPRGWNPDMISMASRSLVGVWTLLSRIQTHTLILETKAAKAVRPEDVEQCQLYLRNGNFGICLLATSARCRWARIAMLSDTRPGLRCIGHIRRAGREGLTGDAKIRRLGREAERGTEDDDEGAAAVSCGPACELACS